MSHIFVHIAVSGMIHLLIRRKATSIPILKIAKFVAGQTDCIYITMSGKSRTK